MKKDKILQNLKMAYSVAGMPAPANLESSIGYWAKILELIPVEQIDNCFEYAIKNNNKTKIPIPGQITKAWESLRDGILSRKDFTHTEVRQWTRTDAEDLLATIDKLTDKYPDFAQVYSEIDPFSAELPDKEWLERHKEARRLSFPGFMRKLSL